MKAVFVGAGRVGAAAAYSCLDLFDDVCVVDVNEALARSVAEELCHASASMGLDVHVSHASSVAEAGEADIYVVTAGAARKPGMSRRELAGVNARIVASIAMEASKAAPGGLMLVVTNPVDAMTMIARDHYEGSVVGLSTLPDTLRLRCFLARKYGTSPRCVEGYVVGEHGENFIVAWSTVRVNGKPVEDEKVRSEAVEYVRRIASEIIAGAGATIWCPASSIKLVLEAYTLNRERILPLGVNLEVSDVEACVGVPCLVGRRIKPLTSLLSSEEIAKLREPAVTVRRTYEACREALTA